MRFAVINGPNLGRLGRREPELYGTATLPEIEERCRSWGREAGHEVRCAQTDGEGELIRLLHAAGDDCEGIVLNAAGYTHTSVALRDAVLAISVPVVEVHLTNPWAREPWRRRNLLEDVVRGRVAGFGPAGYLLALSGLASLLAEGE
jgi:3-dehydroquinate dehydratase-2